MQETAHSPGPFTLIGAEDEEVKTDKLDIRPSALDDYVGQEGMIESLRISVEAAKIQDRPLPHVLLGGPPGLGKTSMAYVLAEEMGSNLTITAGPNIDKPRALTDKLRALEGGDILLIDEIHRMKSKVGETLYSALEDGFVEGGGRLRKASRIDLPPFTLIACTTHVGDIDAPLRDRMQLTFTLSFYSEEEIAQVITRSASIAKIRITTLAISALAKCSRGTPRIANALLFRARDHALVMSNNGVVNRELAHASLMSSGIDSLGLSEADRRYLATILHNFDGGPVGVNAIASSLGERTENLAEQIEPYLQRAGLLIRDRAGRVATEKARKHLTELGLL